MTVVEVICASFQAQALWNWQLLLLLFGIVVWGEASCHV